MKIKMSNNSFSSDKENYIKHNNFINQPMSTKNHPYQEADKYNPLNTHMRIAETVCSPTNEVKPLTKYN